MSTCFNCMKNFPPKCSQACCSCFLILFFLNIYSFLILNILSLLSTAATGQHISVHNELPVANLKSSLVCNKHRIPAERCQRKRAGITALPIVLLDTY